MNVPVKILENGVGLGVPSYATEESAGLDLRAAINDDLVIKAGERVLVPTGISIALPSGLEAQVRPRSGLAYKNGITVLNTPGTIDSDYRGEIKVLLINLGNEDFKVERGMRIAQMVVHKYERVSLNVLDVLDETARAGNGYGSTGIK
ncbi:deoxyuridine 5'-triphosphate nucleotidohydrolase [Alphaproteobacteria bacterium]|nr:deoxyuridine 5'-triphosphate nucleotidohydrolase [Alphaproteobacteria bacterium]